MATNFPTGLDALTNPTPTDTLASPSHADQHANANDAIEALQAKVGVNGSAVTSTLDYKVAQLQAVPAVTIGTTGTLSSERSLTAGAGITITDAGAGSTVTVTQAGLWNPTISAGGYIAANSGQNGTFSPASGNLYLSPMFLSSSITVDRIGVKGGLYTAGTLRLGAYSFSGSTFTRLFDAGTIDLTTSNTGKEITISQTVGPGWVFLAALVENATVGSGSIVQFNAQTFFSPLPGPVPSSLNFQRCGYTFGSISAGSLPATQSLTLSAPETTNIVPQIALRIA